MSLRRFNSVRVRLSARREGPRAAPHLDGANAKEPCPVARTLDIIGDRWTILILRELLTYESRRFQDFETSLRGVSPNTLSARLKKLEEHTLVIRRIYEEHPPRAEYVLTPKGRELGPALRALQLWGQKHTA